ncbi:MAG: UTP--glucose-1-phosphate uridylyltransferase, partial [Planctomycetota bacterium]
MNKKIIDTLISEEAGIRNRSIESLLKGLSREELLMTAEGLEIFRHVSDNLYHKVRAALFISALYRFHLIDRSDIRKLGHIPFEGAKAALERDYDRAIEIFRAALMVQGLNEAVLSALADAYYHLAFKYLADQVKLSISQSRGNHLLFEAQNEDDVPFRIREDFAHKDEATGLYPLGFDTSPVRADPCHSGWSDIFFLGMDFPSGARVINMSVDLSIHGKGVPTPPNEGYCRRIDAPVIRLVSLDLKSSKEVHDLHELFNFANDHLGLLKAGVVASGIIPPSMEGKRLPLSRLLERFLGRPGGFELVTFVRDLPKGSRLAVSTTLLAAIITRLMRFSGQTRNLEGPLTEDERRMVASRAILGEWLGGSGGGWQDSGGIWPGIKVIEGMEATQGDPEYGISRGRLLPTHHVLAKEQLNHEIETRLARSIVMVHGGMSQNVGPILEMVTEKYLLRYEDEWKARLSGYEIFAEIVDAIKNGDMDALGSLTYRDWKTVTKVIIPWATNAFTEDLIKAMQEEFRDDFRGFLMLGGMAGGGMAFIINPDAHDRFVSSVERRMLELKRFYGNALPFVMDPVVFDFRINYEGIMAGLKQGGEALLPDRYYSEGLQNAQASGDEQWIKEHEGELRQLSRKKASSTAGDEEREKLKALAKQALQEASRKSRSAEAGRSPWDEEETARIMQENGFDRKTHAHLKTSLKSGKIGTSRNRLPGNTQIDDVRPDHVQIAFDDSESDPDGRYKKAGIDALKNGSVAVVTFSGGLGSRWTEGAAVVKPIHPFVMMRGKHRSFTEIHLAKSRRAARQYGTQVPHIFTTSFLTHDAFEQYLSQNDHFGYEGTVRLSRARAIGLRTFPMERDLRFLWEELPQQRLDEQQQKIIKNYHEAIIQWTREKGEGEDYTDNLPIQRFNPPGHWHEIPNMLRNGVLAGLMKEHPNLNYLMAHNTDTLGATLDPVILGMHMLSGKAITFEVTPRRFEDKGGGLVLVNGVPQLMESLALPSEEDEFKLSFYNTLTNWIDIDSLLSLFRLSREALLQSLEGGKAAQKVEEAVRRIEERMPTYVTIKEVKLLWG